MIDKEVELESMCMASFDGMHEWESFGQVDREGEYDIVGYQCLACNKEAYDYVKRVLED